MIRLLLAREVVLTPRIAVKAEDQKLDLTVACMIDTPELQDH